MQFSMIHVILSALAVIGFFQLIFLLQVAAFRKEFRQAILILPQNGNGELLVRIAEKQALFGRIVLIGPKCEPLIVGKSLNAICFGGKNPTDFPKGKNMV